MAGEKNQGLQLLDFWVSPFGQRCCIALDEKGLPYEYLEQDLLVGKSELLLRANPVHNKIPVQYLDEAFSGPGTTPLG